MGGRGVFHYDPGMPPTQEEKPMKKVRLVKGRAQGPENYPIWVDADQPIPEGYEELEIVEPEQAKACPGIGCEWPAGHPYQCGAKLNVDEDAEWLRENAASGCWAARSCKRLRRIADRLEGKT